MKKLRILVFVLTAALCVPLAVSAENEENNNLAAPETVQETDPVSDTGSETDPADPPAETGTDEGQEGTGTPENTEGQDGQGDPAQQDPSAETEEPGSEQPSEEDPAAVPPSQEPEEPVEEQPSEEQPSEEQPSEEKPSGEQPSEEQPSEEQPSGEKPGNKEDKPAPDPEKPADGTGEQKKPEPGQKEEKPENRKEPEQTEEEKSRQQELDKARAESKNNTKGITPVANSVWIETIPHYCNGHLLSAGKYGRLQGLTDFTFFTAQESGSYSAYNAGDGMVVLGKYQFTDFGTQGNGTATALISYMNANCGGLYSDLYRAFVVEKRNAVNEWNACAVNDTANFMAMQDQFAYEHYYLRGEAAVEAAGISLHDRPWVVKGMCFSIFNGLGPYDEYGSGAYVITTAGISNEDSNAVFIEKICANMVALYADQYTWLYGRFCDGSDTALGISDKDLALEILSGSLFQDPEPVTDTLLEVTVEDNTPPSAQKKGVFVHTVSVTGKRVREYTNESETRVLNSAEDYTVKCKLNKKHTKLTLTISGQGIYEGQELEQKITLPAETPEKKKS